MKRYFLILLLLPSLGFCSTVYHHASIEHNFRHTVNMHGHYDDTVVVIERPYRTYRVPAPSYYRHYHRYRSYPRYYSRSYYRGRYYNHHQDRIDNYTYNDHLHGHR
ncbi:Uncharacterised protein [Legionella busanensis]|uniref:Lipoprotein n=1 Tax=Legionella busanensis TaxID=190655 RepID=A0A378JVE8_9GAMM|nr:hypothetical protein [Legionella busanensis]STX52182.1 Uncharacterised protein [Legionella busanensis]